MMQPIGDNWIDHAVFKANCHLAIHVAMMYSRLTIRPLFGGHVLLFNKNKFVLRGRKEMSNCPPFRHFKLWKHVQSCLHENFGKFQLKLRPANVMIFFFFCSLLDFGRKTGYLQNDCFFFTLHLILGKNM